MQRFRDLGRSAGEKTQQASKRAADATTSAAGQAANATACAASKAANATTTAADVTVTAAGNTVKAAASVPSAAFNAVFPECPVPAFMLPTGPGIDDYVFIFNLEEMLENLRSGILVRPKIVVWAGRAGDYNLEHFTDELEQDFVRQFNEAQESLAEAFQPHIQRLESRERQLSNEFLKEATGPALRSAANWTALTLLLTPAGALLLIGLGMKPRLKLFGLLRNYLTARGERGEVLEQFNSEMKKLESHMQSKDKALQRAMRRIQVRLHPKIHEIATLISQSEGEATLSGTPEQESYDIPDVQPFLSHPMYRQELPERYLRFVTPNLLTGRAT